MATSEELLSKMNESVGVLQSAQQTVVQGAELIGNTKTLATEAKTAADSAKTIANEAKIVADSAKTLATQASNNAGNALQKSGGTMTGSINHSASSMDPTKDPESNETYVTETVKDKNNAFIGSIDYRLLPTGVLLKEIILRRMVNGAEKFCSLNLRLTKEGDGYVTANTPPVDANNTAVQTKESVARDFLSKSGGTLSGNLNITGTNRNVSYISYANQLQWSNKTTEEKEAYLYPGFASESDMLCFYLGLQRKVNNADAYAQLIMRFFGDGQKRLYAFNPTEEMYDAQLDTLQASINRHPLLIPEGTFYTYLGGANASDTLDLFKGRGLSPSKPFATLEALVRFLEYLYVAANKPIVIQLQTNITSGSVDFHTCNIENLVIQGATSATKLTLTGPLNILSGNVRLQNITLQSSGSLSTFAKVGSGYTNGATLTLGNCTMNGTVTEGTVWAYHNGIVDVMGDVTGTVTGKRYFLQSCGRLLTGGRGASALPGNQDGVASATSVVS